jgi:predicted transcriptional regulator
LTNSSENEKKVQLWSMETGQVVKKWRQKTFQQVQKIINDELDIPSAAAAKGDPKALS